MSLHPKPKFSVPSSMLSETPNFISPPDNKVGNVGHPFYQTTNIAYCFPAFGNSLCNLEGSSNSIATVSMTSTGFAQHMPGHAHAPCVFSNPTTALKMLIFQIMILP